MSPDPRAARAQEPPLLTETQAVLRGTSTMVALFASGTVLLATAFRVVLAEPNARDVLVPWSLLASALCVLSPAWRDPRRAAWTCTGALALVVGVVLATPAGSQARINASMPLFVLALCLVVPLPRAVGAVVGLATVALWSVATGSAPLPVVTPASPQPWDLRWFGHVEVAAYVVCTWLVWHREIADVRLRDHERERRRDRLERAVLRAERARAWRASVARLHETVLNDIRYVLQVRHPDRELLGVELRRAPARRADGATRVSLLTESVGRSAPPGTAVTYAGADLVVAAPEAQPLEAALLELVRNAVRHGGARNVSVEGRSTGTGGELVIRSDGTAPPTRRHKGVGTAVVVEDSLAAVGALLRQDPDAVVVVLRAHEVPRRDDGRTHASLRVVLSGVLASVAVGSVPLAVALAVVEGASAAVSAVALVSCAAVATSGTVRRGAGPGAWTGASAAAAAVPLLLVVAGPPTSCAVAEAGAWTATSVGFALAAVMTWAPPRRWLAMAAPWVVTRLAYASTVPAACRLTSGPHLVTALAIVPVLALAFLSVRGSLRLAERDAADRRRQLAAIAAAEAEVDLVQELGVAVDRASDLLREIAAGREVDAEVRRDLACADADIRSALQVDPTEAGGMSAAARRLVRTSTAAGAPVTVLALRDSGDQRALPDAVVDALERVVLEEDASPPVVQVMTTGSTDTLVLTTGTGALTRAGLTQGCRGEVGDVVLEVEETDAAGRAVLLVHRAAARAATERQ